MQNAFSNLIVIFEFKNKCQSKINMGKASKGKAFKRLSADNLPFKTAVKYERLREMREKSEGF